MKLELIFDYFNWFNPKAFIQFRFIDISIKSYWEVSLKKKGIVLVIVILSIGFELYFYDI